MMGYSKFNYENYLDQNRLREAHRFQPLFEAIENAFNSIEERMTEEATLQEGCVEIVVHRATQGVFKEFSKASLTPSEITGFTVIDNGVGFRPSNWNAYQEVYTSYKKSRGGKGVGRLSYLQAFDHAEVKSVYIYEGEYFCRTFKIVRSQAGTSDEANVGISDVDRSTVLHLRSFNARLRRKAPKALDAIARQVAERFLSVSR